MYLRGYGYANDVVVISFGKCFSTTWQTFFAQTVASCFYTINNFEKAIC